MWEAMKHKLKEWVAEYSRKMGHAIGMGDILWMIQSTLIFLLPFIIIAAILALLAFIVVANAEFLAVWVGGPLFVLWMIFGALKTSPKEEVITKLPDPVEEELTRQRAREMYDTLLMLMFAVIQSVASVTVLTRPHDLYDIQTSAPTGDHFYMDRGVVIYQFECYLDGHIDKPGEDTIQRELQRHVLKQLPRFPLLISGELQGCSPVEIMDVKNLGNHILIDVALTTAASLPLIEARRRARTERQQRQQAVIDQDYPE